MGIERILPVIFLSLFLSGCVLLPDRQPAYPIAHSVPTTAVELPPGDHLALVWFLDGRLFISTNIADETRYFTRDGESWHEVNFPPDPLCQSLLLRGAFTALPDGRLGYFKECGLTATAPGLAPEQIQSLQGYDWQTGETAPLIADQSAFIERGAFSWNPSLTRGVQGMGSGALFGTIYWLTPQRTEPMQVRISDGRRNWSLATSFERLVRGESVADARVGIADTPAWAPDGQVIAFRSSTAAIGRSGPSARLLGEWKIYLMNAAHPEPILIVAGMSNIGNLAWSPDSRTLAFLGRHFPQGDDGLWLYDIAGKQLYAVAYDRFRALAWLPNGIELATFRECTEECSERNLFLTLGNGEKVDFSPTCRDRSCQRELVLYRLDMPLSDSPNTPSGN